jgi:hypothetical protein
MAFPPHCAASQRNVLSTWLRLRYEDRDRCCGHKAISTNERGPGENCSSRDLPVPHLADRRSRVGAASPSDVTLSLNVTCPALSQDYHLCHACFSCCAIHPVRRACPWVTLPGHANQAHEPPGEHVDRRSVSLLLWQQVHRRRAALPRHVCRYRVQYLRSQQRWARPAYPNDVSQLQFVRWHEHHRELAVVFRHAVQFLRWRQSPRPFGVQWVQFLHWDRATYLRHLFRNLVHVQRWQRELSYPDRGEEASGNRD